MSTSSSAHRSPSLSRPISTSNDLLALWAQALETEPAPSGLVLRARFSCPEAAKAAKIGLYKLREKARRASRKFHGPDEPSYDTSPWDGFRIEHPGSDRNGKGGGAELHIYTLGYTSLAYEILPLEEEGEAPG